MEGERRGDGLDGLATDETGPAEMVAVADSGASQQTARAGPATAGAVQSLSLPESSDFDDPEGWMRERPDYWAELAASRPPTRERWLRGRLVAAWEALRTLGRHRDHLDGRAATPDAVWESLFEAAVSAPSAARADVADGADGADAADGVEQPGRTEPARDRPESHRRFALDTPRPSPAAPPPSAPGRAE